MNKVKKILTVLLGAGVAMLVLAIYRFNQLFTVEASIGQLWAHDHGQGVIFLAVFAMVFVLVGAIPLITMSKKKQLQERLRTSGSLVVLPISEVITNDNVVINGHSPYQIVADYHDKISNTVIRYKSNNLDFNPTEYIKQKTVSVYIDQKNPQKYYMDTTFLPTYK